MTEPKFIYAVWIEYKAKTSNPTAQDSKGFKHHAAWYALDFTVPLQKGQTVEIAGYNGKVKDLTSHPKIYDPHYDHGSWAVMSEGNSCRVDLGKITSETYEEIHNNILRLEEWRYKK